MGRARPTARLSSRSDRGRADRPGPQSLPARPARGRGGRRRADRPGRDGPHHQRVGAPRVRTSETSVAAASRARRTRIFTTKPPDDSTGRTDRTRCADPPPAPPPYGGRLISSMGIRYQHAPRGRTKVLVGWSGSLQLAGGGAAATPKRGSSPNASAASEAASADASDDPSSASRRWSSRSFSAAWSRQPLAR